MNSPLILAPFGCIAMVVIGFETVFSSRWSVIWRKRVDRPNKEIEL
jgi:hypothetical protein